MDSTPKPQKQVPAPAPSRREDPWLYPVIALFLLGLLLAVRPLVDTDLGFHLKGGQWILENHRVPLKDTYTYTVTDHDYVDIHWLYQVGLYLLYRLGSYGLIDFANVFVLLAVFFITWKRLRATGASTGICVLLALAVLVGSEFRFRARPETLSWLFMLSTLWVLEKREAGGRDLLFLLPLISLAWANVEGLFPLGWGILAFYFISEHLHHGIFPKRLGAYLFFCVGICLWNPNMANGWFYPLGHLLMLGSINVFKENVGELQPSWPIDGGLFLMPAHYLQAYKLFSFFLLPLCASTFRRRKIHEILLVAVFFILSLVAVRNIPLFLMACAPLAARCWADWSQRELGAFSRLRLPPALGRAPGPALWTVLLLGLCCRVATGAYYASEHRTERVGLGLDEDHVPVKVCEFLAGNRLDGRILNQIGLGGWLDWQGPPGMTFIDGRLEVMGPEFFNEYNLAFKPGGLRALAEKYGAEIILLQPLNTLVWAEELKAMPDWRLVYLDPDAGIFLKKGFGDNVPSLDYGTLLSQYGVPPTLVADQPGLLRMVPLSGGAAFLKGFLQSTAYPSDLFNMGLFTEAYGLPATAEPFFLEGIRRSQGRYYEFYYHLGLIYNQERRFEESLLCMRRALQAASSYPATLALLHNGAGMALLRLGKVEEAVAEFQAASSQDGHFAGPLENLWEIDEHLGRHEDAVQEMKKAVAANPNSADDYRRLGTSYAILKSYPEAEGALRKAFELDPSNPENLVNLATIFQWEGRPGDSLLLYQEGIKHNPGEPLYYLKSADIYLAQGQKGQALGMLKTGLALNPTSPKVLRQIGEDYQRLGKTGLARQCLQRAEELGKNRE